MSESMPPFVQFRLWLRDGPVGERVLGAFIGVVVLGLVVLGLVPVHRHERNGVGVRAGAAGASSAASVGEAGAPATGAAPGAAGESGGAAATGAAGSGGTGAPRSTSNGGSARGRGASSAAASAGAAANGCTGTKSSSPGVTPSEVKLVTTNLSLAGPIGNSTFDVRPDLQAIAKALADDLNQSGGVACGRKVALKQYDVNPLDPNDSQAKCLQAIQDTPLLVIDFGGYLTPASRQCFAQAKVPLVTATAFSAPEVKASSPYLFGPRNQTQEQARNGIFGLRDRGFLGAPAFKKLGLFEDACDPGVNREIDADLAAVGVKPGQVSKFVLTCDIASPPNQITQAVLQHKLDGATHVFFATSTTNDQNYVRIAVGQSFRPAYGTSDYGEGLTQAGGQNWDASFDGATGITSERVGEFNSGIANAERDACDKTVKRHGVPGYTSEKKDTALVAYCDLFSFFRATLDQAGANPTRATLAAAVSKIGLFKSANVGDGTFNRPGKMTGGDFQRPARWHADCQCWKILDPAYRPAYT